MVNAKHKLSNGSCGIYFSEFVEKLKRPYSEFEIVISEMYTNEEIQIREGINGFMLMKVNKPSKTVANVKVYK